MQNVDSGEKKNCWWHEQLNFDLQYVNMTWNGIKDYKKSLD